MITPLGNETVIVQRTTLTTTDRYDKQVRDWSAATSTTITGVSVQPVSVAEAVVDREYAATHLVMYAPPDVDLAATDRVVVRGDVFEVDGPPARWTGFDGNPDHIVVSLKMLTG